jgi:hypothetical protein
MRLLILSVLLLEVLAPPTSLRASGQNDAPEITVKPSSSITSEEVAALLGGYLWNVELNVPKGATEVSVELEGAGKGQKAHTLCGGTAEKGADVGGTRDLLVAVVPVNGGITDATMLRVSIVMFSKTSDGTRLSTFGGEAINPFKRLTFTQTHVTPQRVERGIFELIEASGGSRATFPSPVADVDQAILLKIEAK